MKYSLKIILLILITIIIIVLALSWKNQTNVSFSISETAKKAETVLSLSPNPLLLTSKTGHIDISMDTGSNTVNFVQIKLLYNPNHLSDIKVTKGPFMEKAEILNTFVNQEMGTLTYLLALPKDVQPLQGKGVIATISFTSTLKPGNSTTVSFTKDTMVTNDQTSTSLLKKTYDAKIMQEK